MLFEPGLPRLAAGDAVQIKAGRPYRSRKALRAASLSRDRNVSAAGSRRSYLGE
jgi:hypothetical protein